MYNPEMQQRYIAFLRGINVGGHVVKMEQLRELFTELKLQNVRSYINSGNIFFDTASQDISALTAAIEQHLKQSLGYEVPTFLRTTDEVVSILQQNPFTTTELTTDKRFCVVFTHDPISRHVDLPVTSSKNDMEIVAINEYEAFVVWYIIHGRPPAGKFPPDILPTENTTRFFHTLTKIQDAALKS
jgi:uncharacterized protein (DUF1697 family)